MSSMGFAYKWVSIMLQWLAVLRKQTKLKLSVRLKTYRGTKPCNSALCKVTGCDGAVAVLLSRRSDERFFLFSLGGGAIHYICETLTQRKNHKGNV